MHYSCEVTMGLPRRSVLQLLADRSNDVAWRPDLTMCETLVGEPGQPGAETRLLYLRAGGGVRETMEHVESNQLPDAIEYSLRSPTVIEHQLHRFVEEKPTKTRWIIESTVELHHAGLGSRRHSTILERETQRAMESFRDFAEGPSGRARLAAPVSLAGPRYEIHAHKSS